MTDQPQTRYHGKVRVQVGETLIEVNIFEENREKLYLEIQKAITQFSADIKPATAAQREIARAEQARAAQPALAPQPVLKPAQPKPSPQPQLGVPNCPACRTGNNVEARQFLNADTGEMMERFKCKGCGRWIGKATPVVEELPY